MALFDKIAEDRYCDMFEEFSIQVLTCLESLLITVYNGSVGSTVKRKKLWSAFHQKRTTELANFWKQFLQLVHLDLDAVVSQTVTQALYENKIIVCFAVASIGPSVTSSSIQTPNLSHEEECILRYAARYIPFVLLRKHEKSTSEASFLIYTYILLLCS